MFAPMRYGKTQEPLYLETQPSRQGRVCKPSGHLRSACNACREKKVQKCLDPEQMQSQLTQKITNS